MVRVSLGLGGLERDMAMPEHVYFEVVNWDRFQHYKKDRTPPWIRLYNALIENYEWTQLTDDVKGQLVAIWLLASRLQNRLPWDPAWVQVRAGLHSPPKLGILRSAGFIKLCDDCKQDASTMLAECLQDATPEESRGEESRTPPTPPAEQGGGLFPDDAGKKAKKTPRKKRSTTWLTEFDQRWHDAFGGKLPFGQAAKALKPLVDEHGENAVLSAWSRYCRESEAQYASPTAFASKYGYWANGQGSGKTDWELEQEEAYLARAREGARRQREAEA
jgi:hypothetical protein